MKTLKYLVLVCVVVMLCACECEKTKAYHIPEDKKMNLKVPDTLIYATADLSDYDTLYLLKREDLFERVQTIKSRTCLYKVISDKIIYYFETSSKLEGVITQTVYSNNYLIIEVQVDERINPNLTGDSPYAPAYVDYIGNTKINSVLYYDVYKTDIAGGYVFVNNKLGIISYYNYKKDKIYYYQPK